MQKFSLLIYTLCTLIVLGFSMSSCKDDDDPVVPAKLSVASETLSIAENGGTIEVELVLDKAAPATFTVEYSLGGTAISPADYSVVGKEGEIEIAKGATSAVIEIDIVNDAVFEGNETIEVTLEEVDTDKVTITNDDESVITITEDDAQVSVSFETTTTVSVTESDGILSLNVVLSPAALNDVTIQYELSGTARDSVTARNAEPDLPSDYAIRGGTPGQIQIAAGQTTGVIRLGLYSDFIIEDGNPNTDPWDPETIIITLTEANGVQINPDKDELQIDLHQQDGKVIVLLPDIENETTEVDMDLFLWIGDIGADLEDLELISLSAFEGSDPEVVFIPETITEVQYGLSYVYWGGDVSPMEFESRFIDFVDGELGDGESFTATYTLANLNPWENLSDVANVNIAQTFEVNADAEVVNISAITVPTEGSRPLMLKLPAGTKKSKGKSILRNKF